METNIGKLTATLSETDVNAIDSLMTKLNENVQPSEKLSRDNVHIRCMYIVSDEINSYGGKFPIEELQRIKDLIIDSPVLIGHKKDDLPIGRNFHAELVYKNNTHWVKSYFYWMKSSDNSEDLLKNIDGGVIKECSIGFTFLHPECSVCGNDIRNCRHEPLRSYTFEGITSSCFFYYKQVDKVLETSLVYRGANPNTSISNELLDKTKSDSLILYGHLDSIDELSNQSTYMLAPNYIGFNAVINTSQNSIAVQYENNKNLPDHLIRKYFKEFPKNLNNQLGQIIGYRGKERCSLDELQKYLHGNNSVVRRIELRLIPGFDVLQTEFKNIKVMRYKLVDKHNIEDVAQSIMTKDGIRIWSLHNNKIDNFGYTYNPNRTEKSQLASDISSYQISIDASKNIKLTINQNNIECDFLIERFDLTSFTNGTKFIAEKYDNTRKKLINKTKHNSGRLIVFDEGNNYWHLGFEEHFLEKIRIRPIIINSEEKYIMQKSN